MSVIRIRCDSIFHMFLGFPTVYSQLITLVAQILYSCEGGNCSTPRKIEKKHIPSIIVLGLIFVGVIISLGIGWPFAKGASSCTQVLDPQNQQKLALPCYQSRLHLKWTCM